MWPIACLLVVEGVFTALWMARMIPTLAGHDGIVVALMMARGLVGAAQLTSGLFLFGRRPAAATIARSALLVSAVLMTLEVGERLAPSDLEPGLRWPVVVGYWVYAISAAWLLGKAVKRMEGVKQS